MVSQLLPTLCQVLARWFLPCFDISRPGSTLPSPVGKRTAGSCGLSTKMMVHFSWYAGTGIALGARKPPRFCLECRCRACANPQVTLLLLFPSPVQVLPVVVPPSSAMLVFCRWNQQCIRDYLRPFPAPAGTAQGRCKERSMYRCGPYASASSFAART